MILVDFNAVVIANAVMMAKLRQREEHNLDAMGLLRHMVLNSIRRYRTAHGYTFGEMVLCGDGKNVWRKEHFPYYKANRKKAQDAGYIDWVTIRQALGLFPDEFRENLPYRFIKFDGAEADDVIAALAAENPDPTMIVSADRDFLQLQDNPNVMQWNPVKDRRMTSTDPLTELKEKVITGDTGDGIPNILSPDDVFITPGARQAPMTKVRLAEYMAADRMPNEVLQRNFDRNSRLIDFRNIPKEVRERVEMEYDEAVVASRKKLRPYFIEHRLAHLFESIQEF